MDVHRSSSVGHPAGHQTEPLGFGPPNRASGLVMHQRALPLLLAPHTPPPSFLKSPLPSSVRLLRVPSPWPASLSRLPDGLAALCALAHLPGPPAPQSPRCPLPPSCHQRCDRRARGEVAALSGGGRSECAGKQGCGGVGGSSDGAPPGWRLHVAGACAGGALTDPWHAPHPCKSQDRRGVVWCCRGGSEAAGKRRGAVASSALGPHGTDNTPGG